MSFVRSVLRHAAAGLIALAVAVTCAAAPGAAADRGLTLFVLAEQPEPDARGNLSYAPGARAVTRLIFENRGDRPLDRVRVEVELTGAVPVVGSISEWRREGNVIRATIAGLAPGDSIELPFVVELADGTERGARGTGGEALIRARVPATGESLIAGASWPIASCADAFHAALREVRYGEFAALRAAVEAARNADPALPGATVFAFDAAGDRDAAGAARRAEEIARARGLDGYYLTDEIRWLSGRLIADIGAYLGQARNPGLCTGVVEWTGVLQDHIGRFGKHAGEMAKHRSDLEPLVLVRLAEAGGESDEGSGAIEAWPAAAALLATLGDSGAAGEGAAVFEAAAAAIGAAGDSLSRERRQALNRAFATLERLWYLELAETRARAVADGFADTLEAIRAAHATRCTCGG